MNIILIILLCTSSFAASDHEFTRLINDFLIHERDTTTATGLLCWKTGELVSLLKSVSSHSISMNIVNDCRIDDFNVYWHHKHLFVLDFSCDFAEKCLETVDQHKLFASPNRWLILDKIHTNLHHCNESNSISNCPERYFSDKYLLSDSNLVVAIKDVPTKNIKLTQYYKRRVNLGLITEDYGHWNKAFGIIDKRSEPLISLRRRNTQRTVISACVTTLNNDTKYHLADYKDKHIDTISKSNFGITNHLIDFLNGSKHFNFADDWGFQPVGNKWGGLIGQLVTKEVDIAGTPIFFLPQRIPLIEYIGLTTPTVAKFVFRQPPLSFVSNLFILPFRWTVWSATIALVIFSCFALYLSTYWEKLHPTTRIKLKLTGTNDQYVLGNRWGDILLLAIGAIAQQGSVAEPRTLSGRIITIILLISVMFLYTSYSANIVALLQSESHNIKTISDLLNSRLTLGVEDATYNRFYFPRFTDPVRKAIWAQKISPKGSKPNFLPLEAGVKQMQKGLYAFHMEVGVGYKFVSDIFQEDEKCGLYEIQYLETVNPWYCIQKNSSFKEPLKIGMRKILQAGLQSREFKKVYTARPVCSTKSGKFVSVGLIDIGPALIWFGFGIIIAIVLFVLEKLTKKIILHNIE